MKITDSDVILAGEKEMFDAIKDDLDWNAVKEFVIRRIDMKSLNSKGGEIVVHDNRIAFKINLELKADVSLMFDRNGDYIDSEPADPEFKPSVEAKSSDDNAVTEEMPDFETEYEAALEVDMDSVLENEVPLPADLADDLSINDFGGASEKESSELDMDIEIPGLREKDKMSLDTEDKVDQEIELPDLDALDESDFEMDLNFSDDDQDIIDLEQEFTLSEKEADDDLTDDDKDIDDIIKNSRKFWGQKK